MSYDANLKEKRFEMDINRSSKYSKDVYLGLGFIIFGVVLAIQTSFQDWRVLKGSAGLTPATLPLISIAIIVFAGGLVALGGFRKKEKKGGLKGIQLRKTAYTFILMLLWLVCSILLRYIGFTLSTTIALSVSMSLWGVKKRTSLFAGFLIAVVINLIFHYLFRIYLAEPLLSS